VSDGVGDTGGETQARTPAKARTWTATVDRRRCCCGRVLVTLLLLLRKLQICCCCFFTLTHLDGGVVIIIFADFEEGWVISLQSLKHTTIASQ
jgi:hypothetical protein